MASTATPTFPSSNLNSLFCRTKLILVFQIKIKQTALKNQILQNKFLWASWRILCIQYRMKFTRNNKDLILQMPHLYQIRNWMLWIAHLRNHWCLTNTNMKYLPKFNGNLSKLHLIFHNKQIGVLKTTLFHIKEKRGHKART